MATEAKELHAVMFPYFAFGHINAFIQLSNKLCNHGVRISFLTAPVNISRIKSSFLPSPSIQIIPIQIPHVQGLPSDLHNTNKITPEMHDLLKQAIDLMQPQIKILLSNLQPHFVFFDFFQHWLPKLCSEIDIKTLCFSTFSAISVAYLTVPARLRSGEMEPSFDDLKKPPIGFPKTSVTSLKTFQAENLSIVFKSFDGSPAIYCRVIDCITNCSAVVIRSSDQMEGPYLEFIEKQFQKKFLLSGPLAAKPESGRQLDQKWADWLAQHPSKSVIFCSFGSEQFLTNDQIYELATGLELTGVPFLLVLNFPDGVNAEAELERALPKHFMETIKGRGVIHIGWVQQKHILAHDSIGCYICHCGFSSINEGLMNNCQLVLLPMKGDQFFNSKLVADELKAAVEVNRRDEDGYFSKESIRDAIKTVMVEVNKEPGKSIRENYKKWNQFLLDAETQDKFISDLVQEMKAMA